MKLRKFFGPAPRGNERKGEDQKQFRNSFVFQNDSSNGISTGESGGRGKYKRECFKLECHINLRYRAGAAAATATFQDRKLGALLRKNALPRFLIRVCVYVYRGQVTDAWRAAGIND